MSAAQLGGLARLRSPLARHGTQCTGNRLNPQPPTTTVPSITPADCGHSASRSAAHHQSAPRRAMAIRRPGMPRVRGPAVRDTDMPPPTPRASMPRHPMTASSGRR
ncbi:hypothetical protein [Streptomyces sp. NPDC093589]|uniref:hypothetical protein n=1 Tax=Streptomyces sp. NPDC093589 TaxID=3366043 RepID=UPI0037FCC038